jgi:hypothetical protein
MNINFWNREKKTLLCISVAENRNYPITYRKFFCVEYQEDVSGGFGDDYKPHVKNK